MPKRFVQDNGIIFGSLDENDLFVQRQAASYLLGILKHYPILDRDTLEVICWILGAKIEDLTQIIAKNLKGKKKELFNLEISESLDLDDYAREIAKILKNNKSLTSKVRQLLMDMIEERYNELLNFKESRLEKNSRQFKELFSLTDEELSLCTFYFITENWEYLRRYFVHNLNIEDYSGRKYLQAALNFKDSTLENLLNGKLSRLGIIERTSRGLDFDSEFLTLFIDPTNPILPDSLFKEAEHSALPLKYHLIPEKNIQFVLGLLSKKKDTPTHILFYGPAGTGKTSFAKALASELADPVYEITLDSNNKTQKRRAAISTCLNLTNAGTGSVLIVDEADNILTTMNNYIFSGEVQDKGWLNTFMEEPGVRIIWIVNSLRNIEDSVLRRFSFSLYFPDFSRQKRIQLWKTIVKHNKVGKYIKENSIQELAKEYEVSAGVIDLAIKQAKKSSDIKKISFTEKVRMGLDAHIQMQNNGIRPKKISFLDPDFSLQGLNIHGDWEKTIRELNLYNQKQKMKEVKGVKQYNLLFYGPPGTGKSEMAKYIAQELDRDLMIKRASDLLDKYVGSTEKKIARMFAEAEAKEAVLVVDEADSFIFGRDIAERSWEISHVNEFLTQMENYQGILICTTNRFQGLDQASIRRFNRKLSFDFLSQEGVSIFYEKFLSSLSNKSIDRQNTDKLLKLKRLTPGDFKNVRDRYALGVGKVSPAQLISALEAEERLKKSQQGGEGIGF